MNSTQVTVTEIDPLQIVYVFPPARKLFIQKWNTFIAVRRQIHPSVAVHRQSDLEVKIMQ
jgi:hypothetical protein